MARFLNYFLKGLVLLAPLAITLYVCARVFVTIDGWLGLPIPGAGFVATVVLITLFGFLASSFLTRRMLTIVEGVLERLPFVRLLYSSTRDLLNAFVGEKRRFDKPVIVTPFLGGPARAIGFVTQETLESMGMREHVAVYLPQSYNFAGSLLIFPTSAIEPLDAESADVMAFIVSGGVTMPPPPRRSGPVARQTPDVAPEQIAGP
jgi:uncharacterized membrane protein